MTNTIEYKEIDKTIKPSDIKRGRHLKYYYKVEYDGKLGLILDFFEKNGDTRSMSIEKRQDTIQEYEEKKKNLMKKYRPDDKFSETRNISKYIGRANVVKDVLEEENGKIQFRDHIIEGLKVYQKDDIVYRVRKGLLQALNKLRN